MTQVSIALRIASIVGLMSLCMFGVTTFLFHFSGGQYRMEPVVRYGAYAAFAAAMLLAAVVWKMWLRSPSAAVIGATISAIVIWAFAVFIECRSDSSTGHAQEVCDFINRHGLPDDRGTR